MEQLGGDSKKNFKKSHCSPISDSRGYSCLDDKLILKIAMGVNKIFKDDKKYKEIDINSSIKNIHNKISKVLSEITGCSSEVCWMSIKKLMKFLGKDVVKFKNSFKTFMPEKWIKDYNTWLRTDDIENCLKQYQKKDNRFYFYGAVPIDFNNCLVSDLCSINLKDHVRRGENKIGAVFNTDPHDESGEHWIAFFIDIGGKNLGGVPGIYYFDSYGDKPPKEINNLIRKVKKQGSDIHKNFKYFYNDHAYQKENYQCGMFAIHFIKKMIEGANFEKFLNVGLTDNKMLNKRKEYFISPLELKCKYNL